MALPVDVAVRQQDPPVVAPMKVRTNNHDGWISPPRGTSILGTRLVVGG